MENGFEVMGRPASELQLIARRPGEFLIDLALMLIEGTA